MFKLYNILFSFFLFFPLLAIAQEQDENPLGIYYTLGADSLVCVHLPNITITPKGASIDPTDKRIPRKYREGTRAYNRTIRNLKVVYPIAKKAAKKIEEIERQLAEIKGELKRKAFIKEEYKKLMDIYKEPIKKLKISQGRMLIVLIHRETGNTSFEHIKTYKGGFTAFFWQGVAQLFGNDLKKGYDPNGDDIYLEYLIQKYERGEL